MAVLLLLLPRFLLKPFPLPPRHRRTLVAWRLHREPCLIEPTTLLPIVRFVRR
jgi:hypothetical protein